MKRSWFMVSVAVVALLASACSSGRPSEQSSDSIAPQAAIDATADEVATAPAGSAAGRPERIEEFSTRTREVFHFDNIGEMVATSAVVVEAVVASVKPGRKVTIDSDQSLRYDEVTLRVIRVFHGSAPETIVIEEDGILAARSNANDGGIYFLMAKRDRPGFYRLANSAARYRLDAAGRLHGSNPDNQLSQSLEKLGLDGLRDEISSTADAVKRGEFLPVPYPTPEP